MSMDINLIFATAFVVLVVWAAISDAKGLRIANWISIAIIGLFALYVGLGYLDLGPKPVAMLGHIGVSLAVLVIGFAVFAFGAMGAGDVKLMSAVALWAGPGLAIPFLLFTSIAGGTIGLIMVTGMLYMKWDDGGTATSAVSRFVPSWLRRGILPYGVAICIGALVTVPGAIVEPRLKKLETLIHVNR
jgi:prepilin peptidase CpaA